MLWPRGSSCGRQKSSWRKCYSSDQPFWGAFGAQLWDQTELQTDLGEASEELPVIPIFERPYHGFGWFWPEQRRQKSVLTGYYEGEKGSPRTLSIRGRVLDGSGASGVRPEEPKQGFGGSV